ncbi:hypothetical protein [Paludibaculum fermentans]|uniref:hypothetical protein n=1 Tax=Paludibaculum fermentans TaxID=1473598 RepID=UPI003EBF7210
MIDKLSSSILFCAAIALSGSSASVLMGQVPQGRAEFTVNVTVVSTGAKTGKSIKQNRTFAQRSDGSTREDVTDHLSTRGRGMIRNIKLVLPAERKMVHGHPEVLSVSTFVMSDEEVQQSSILPRFDEKCSTNKGVERAAFAGFSSVAGQRVAIYEFADARRSTELSLAPELGCYPLRMVVNTFDDKGKIARTYKSEAYSVDLGAPDPRLFDDPFAGYVERKPSEISSLIQQRVFHSSASSEEVAESRQRLDDYYDQRMPRGGTTKDPAGRDK